MTENCFKKTRIDGASATVGKDPKSILVIAPLFPPDRTGSSTFARVQAMSLSRDFDIRVVTHQNPQFYAGDLSAESRAEEDFTLVRIRSFRLNLGQLTWNYDVPIPKPSKTILSEMISLRRGKYDGVIIHSTMFPLSLLSLFFLPRKQNSVLVVHTRLSDESSRIMAVFKVVKIVLAFVCRFKSVVAIAVDAHTEADALEFLPRSRVTRIPVAPF